MGEWSIYGSDGSVKAVVKKLEYSGEFMGETIVTCDVYSPSPINFDVGDYLSYRDEMFAIDYNATRKKQARNNTYGNGFVYEGMRFSSYAGETKKCEFLDYVLNDNLVHYSQLPQFSFFAESVDDLADRVQANMNRYCEANNFSQENYWKFLTPNKTRSVQRLILSGYSESSATDIWEDVFGSSTPSRTVGKTNIEVQASSIKCFDALKIAYEQFECQYVIRGRIIVIGTSGSVLETNYTYGKGNGLKTIERSVDDSDQLITRLRAYGNTTNMPANYYRNLNTLCYADYYETLGPYTDNGADLHFHPNGSKFANNWFTEKSGSDSGHYWVEVSLDRELWLTAIASTNAGNGSVGFSVVSTGMYGSNTQDMLEAFNTQLGSTGRLYFRKGVNYDNWGAGKESGSSVPASLFIDRLMLPSFPTNPDPYIDSSNIGTLGIREKSVYFDGSDPELPDIHPSLEGMTAHDIDPVHGSSSDYLDEIAADATEIGGGDITTDGQFVNMDEVPGFQVKVKDIGFDINSYLSTETATLSMKSGKCGGREFTIVKVEKAVGGGYLLTCQRTEDINLYFPYKDYPIEAGDKFVLTGIEMPDAYVDAASARLLAAAQEYLDKHSQPQYMYAIKMDDIWMQRQRDNSQSESVSYYWNLKEGDVMKIKDENLGIYEESGSSHIAIQEVIDRLTIREGYSPVPEIEVVLRKEKPQGTIGVLLNRVKQLEKINSEQLRTINRQSEYITLVLGDRINDIANQADHQQVTYFGTETPTLNNYPYTDWYNQSQGIDNREIHIGDMYYDKTNHRGYLFEKNGNTYVWTRITDEHTLEALEIASHEQDTIDGKRRVFITGAGNLPNPPYEVGDLWVNAVFPANSTSTDESQHRYFNDILKCIIEKADGGTASINDWSLASRYIGEQELDNVYAELAGDIDTIREQEDKKFDIWFAGYVPLPLLEVVKSTTGKHPATEGWLEETDEDTYVTSSDTNPVSGKTYYKQTTSSNAPASGWSDSDKSVHIQDLFYDTSREPASEGGRAYRWKSLEIDGDTEYRWMDVSDADTIAALEKISDVASDGVLSGGAEKTRVLNDWKEAVSDYTAYTERATALGIDGETEYRSYKSAINSLGTFLNGGNSWTVSNINTIPSWINSSNLEVSNNITGSYDSATGAEAYRRVWQNYNTCLTNLIEAVHAKEKQLIDDIASDGILSAGTEKTQLLKEWQNAVQSYSANLAYAVDRGLTGKSEYSAFVTAFGNLAKFLNGGSTLSPVTSTPEWLDDDFSEDTDMTNTSITIGGTTYIGANAFRKVWQDYYSTLGDIDEMLDLDTIKVFVGSTAPTPPYSVGDMWIDATYSTIYEHDILKCKTAKTANGSFDIVDWEKASKYTDDSALDEFKANQYVQALISGTISSDIAAANYQNDTVLMAMKGVLTKALTAQTIVDGGLMLTSAIFLRQLKANGNPDVLSDYTTWSGINGVYNPKDETQTGGAKGHGIGAWFGGDMVDKEMLSSSQIEQGWNAYRWAKSLFRFDGSGYVSDGGITWNEEGQVTIKGYSIDAPTITVQNNNVLTESSGDNRYVTIAYFNSLFQAYNESTLVPTNTANPTITNIKILKDAWTDGELSANGYGSGGGGGGGGGGITLQEMWYNLGLSDSTKTIDISHISTALSGYFNGITISGGTKITPSQQGVINIPVTNTNRNVLFNNKDTEIASIGGQRIYINLPTANINSTTKEITIGTVSVTPLTSINSSMVNTALGFTLNGTQGTTYNLDTISSNASTAYGWGNHASAGYATQTWVGQQGYLTSFTETDPVFTASAAHGITSSDISNWDSKTSNTGTVTSVTIKATSPIAIDSSSAITTSGTRTLSHANSGVTAGTYKSVTVNATGHVTAGTNPTTLSGYGITDAYTKTEADGLFSGVFVGTCTSAADAQAKVGTVDNSFRLAKGVIVSLKFTYTNTFSVTAGNLITLDVNNTGAKNIYYANTTATTGTNAICYGSANYYITYMYDGTNWVWLNRSIDSNTTYSVMTDANMKAGTETTGRLVSAKLLADNYLPLSGGTLTGATTVSTLTISDTSGIAHLNFSRGSNSYNYVTAPSAGKIGFIFSGTSVSTNNVVGYFSSTGLTIPNNKAISVTGNVTAASFIKSGATATNFLKANGDDAALTAADIPDLSGTYLPLTGSNMDEGATIRLDSKFSTTRHRYLTLKGSSIIQDLSEDTGSYAGYFYNVITKGSDNNTHAVTGLGYYGTQGSGTGLTYLYFASDGHSYNNPEIKIYPDGEIESTKNITALSFTKSGGTSSQFLKADGSVDSNTYVKQSDVGNISGLFTGSCTSAADAQAKVATVGSNFSLVDGVTVAIKFTNSNTFSATDSDVITLNVNNTGAKQIWYAASKANTGASTSIYGYASRYTTYMYDATNDVWVWLAHGADDNTNTAIRVYRQTSSYNNDYPILVSRTLASSIGTVGSNGTYSAVYGVIFNTDQPTINPNTGKMKVKALAVNGVDITGSSDARLKDVIGDVTIGLENIANAPSKLFTWKDKRDERMHLGTLAQYWENYAPQAICNDDDGYKVLDYGALALSCVTEVADETVKLKNEIAALKQQVAELERRSA